MSRKVYQFGLRPPTVGADIVRAQLRYAREYKNDLIAIERARRGALRAVDDTEAVRAAVEGVKVATKADRKAAITALRLARKAARAEAVDELARIQECDSRACKGAYHLTALGWGTRLDLNAAHQQSRSAPLYGDDAVTPSDPHFVRWRGFDEGQLAVQLQGGLATQDAFEAKDTRVRIVRGPAPNRALVGSGTLWLRVGSDGRAPVWAEWPIILSREIPTVGFVDGALVPALWKWVRVSCRRDGAHERWSCEITVDDPAPMARTLDRELDGAIAVEWEWSPLDAGGICVARWADTRGQTGSVALSARDAEGIRKPDGIRAVRDVLLNDLRPKLADAIRGCGEPLPPWLTKAAETIPYWKSPSRFYELIKRWRAEKCDAARGAYELLDAWWYRDAHLYDYEAGARGQSLRRRRDFFRVLAAKWAREYRTALLSDQDLSREARWGEESDVRFTAGVSELRGAIRNAFGEVDAVNSLWRDAPLVRSGVRMPQPGGWADGGRVPVGGGDEAEEEEEEEDEDEDEDERSWCERTRDAWIAGGARGDGRFAERKEKTGNAWAARKARAAAKRAETETARKAESKCAE